MDREAPRPPRARDDSRRGRIDHLRDWVGQNLIPPGRRVFVNRSLRMDRIEHVGFDMDYSLARYKKRNIEELSFRLTIRKLIDKYGYPEEIAELPYDPSFVVRGLLVDKKHGNILKMNTHNHVGRAYHGRRALSRDDHFALYRNVKIKLNNQRYHWIDTLFALPEAALYADLIDLFELRLGRTAIDFVELFDHIRAAIDECHRDGSLKSIVKADPERFIEVDPDLPVALHKLRSAKKRLFILTNSLWPYTDTVMSFILDGKLAEYPNWEHYFDFVLVGADKPSFFTETRPFKSVDRATGEASPHHGAFERRGVYQGGSIEELQRLQGLGGETTLYVGDHIYGDIIRTRKDTLWRTSLILEELEDELELSGVVHRAQVDLLAMEERIEQLQDEITELRLKLAAVEHALDDAPSREGGEVEELAKIRRHLKQSFDRDKRALKDAVERRDQLSAEVDRCYNPFWGSVFKEGPDNSYFGRQVEMHACLYTSRVSNLRFYSPQHYFRAPRHWMAHEKA